MRKIIHIDMDSFYASVEQRDHPEYRNKPVVVGGPPDSRGVVATASYEARAFGIHSAMPCSKAFKLCPQAIFVLPRFEVYSAISKKIREIFHRYTDLVEPLSLDEAFLDISEDKLGIGSALEIAQEIKDTIQRELNLTASAGISINKFVAKVASNMQKPNGLTFIGPSKIEKFMEKLPVEKFFGVGKVTATKMKSMHLHTGADLKKLSEQQLIHVFGKSGKFYYQVVRGIDDRPVTPNRETKSISAEDTFSEDTSDQVLLLNLLKNLSVQVSNKAVKYNLKGRTLTLKVKYGDFKIVTKSVSTAFATNKAEEILESTAKLLLALDLNKRKVRLLGIGMSNFMKPALKIDVQQAQLSLNI